MEQKDRKRPQEFILKTTGLTKIYSGRKVVQNVTMHVKKGDIYGFIGKNGAGKTTFMRMVAGLARPDAGEIELFGSTDLERQRVRIGTLIEQPGLYRGMTAAENLETARRAYGITDRNAVRDMLAFIGLEDAGNKKTADFSMGMKQRLGIAMALLRNPDFLILDEPINGLDPQGIRQIRNLLQKLNQERAITMLIASHILGELSKIATVYGMICGGELVEELDAQDLAAKCRRCQRIVVDHTEQAVHLLEEELKIKDYDVPERHVIRIYEQLENFAQINQRLALAGAGVKESYLAGQDLESYFMDLLENEQEVSSW